MRKLIAVTTLVVTPLLGFTQKVFVTENHQSSDFVISFVDDIDEADWVWSLTTDMSKEASFDANHPTQERFTSQERHEMWICV